MFETLEFYSGKEIHFDTLSRRLVELGYTRLDAVGAEGEFSVRGSVVDVFPVHFSLPVRLELDHERIESIYTFDPQTGERLEPHRMVIVLPVKGGVHHGKHHRAKEFLSVEGYDEPMDPFVDIEPGDLVVHVLHGIARFRGITPMKDKKRGSEDHLALEFAEKNVLYVPMRDLHLIQRYIAFGKANPELSHLGSKTWEKLKEKTKKGVFSFASELLDVQAKRRALRGYPIAADTEWQKKLESEFPYEETPDQLKALEAVKKDLEAPIPMDRLLCGDVGYGKTEVALRAAFKVVMGGKQVAMLVPTTLLAEQHFETFSDRMKNFPVKIGMLSRFQTAGELKEIVAGAVAGTYDIVIGTHRILSKDVAFKNLGLVIIDEEQRFGVRHKEHLKRLRLMVDVLTLTATPIPRTLYMSLVGTKDMSTINTPPAGRKPVRTIVTESDDEMIRQAIEKELERKGQVFFVHNRVKGIEAVAKKLAQLVPKARIAVGHGQMPAKPLESVMKKFIHGEVDVLVSTTIVESGIDIPNANTLIINHADHFGLSELYQLRGRVGRFTRNAYAYLLVPKGAVMTEESKRKLTAIEKFSYLGSGFSVAMEDLEIRGAGNILGVEQHGYISSIGFDLYCRILRETVQTLKKKP